MKDVESILGYIPAPDVREGQFFIEILFKVGPFRGELPLSEADLEPWERRRGIELLPWQAEMIVDMSSAYMEEMHISKDPSALCPWPRGVKIWKYVCDKKNGPAFRAGLKQKLEEQPNNGSRKRHRNPAEG